MILLYKLIANDVSIKYIEYDFTIETHCEWCLV